MLLLLAGRIERRCIWTKFACLSVPLVFSMSAAVLAQQPPATSAAVKPFLERGGVELKLAGAQAMVAAAAAKAEEMKLAVNIAVVDDGGHLLAFARMDGARPGSANTALTKAVAAATMRRATGPAGPPGADVDVHLNLSLQNAAAVSGGKITTLFGGVNAVVEGKTIGAIGVGGATGEQDAEIARAGIAALLAGAK